jgi:hypothetical protein
MEFSYLSEILSVLAGKLAAEVVAERAAGLSHRVKDKDIQLDILTKAVTSTPKDPIGVSGDGAIPFGGGAVLTSTDVEYLMNNDPSVFQQ